MSNPWKPGQSGNPKGRPPKGRVLTDVLAKEINKVVTATGGERISGKRLLARAVVDGLLTGRIVLPIAVDDAQKVYEVKGEGWVDLLKWLYAQVDGAPKQYHDLTSDDKPLSEPITDEERVIRLAALLDAARARRDGQATEERPDLDAAAGAADTGV